jgi:quercetin dioxygenase-like cupin family protein
MRKLSLILLTALGLSVYKLKAQGREEPERFTFSQLQHEQLAPGIVRKMIFGNDGTIGYFTFQKGAVVPLHHHENEQYSVILQGSVVVKIGVKEYLLKAGEGIVIPSNLPHSFEALEDDTIDLDFFTPVRLDWLNGTDQYFNSALKENKNEK